MNSEGLVRETVFSPTHFCCGCGWAFWPSTLAWRTERLYNWMLHRTEKVAQCHGLRVSARRRHSKVTRSIMERISIFIVQYCKMLWVRLKPKTLNASFKLNEGLRMLSLNQKSPSWGLITPNELHFKCAMSFTHCAWVFTQGRPPLISHPGWGPVVVYPLALLKRCLSAILVYLLFVRYKFLKTFWQHCLFNVSEVIGDLIQICMQKTAVRNSVRLGQTKECFVANATRVHQDAIWNSKCAIVCSPSAVRYKGCSMALMSYLT